MQARFATFSAIAALLAFATPAGAQTLTLAELQARGACPEQPVCGHCGADINATDADPNSEGSEAAAGGDGGIWRSTDSAAQPTAAPNQVQTTPQANMPIFLELDGVPGETSGAPSSPPPPPPRPPSGGGSSLPSETLSLNFDKYEAPHESSAESASGVAAQQTEQAALLLPAIQRARPVAETAATESAEAEPQRPRRRFSLSIGGVTLSSDGGVSVAVGDITGDGHDSSPSSSDRPAPSARPARRGGASRGN